MLVALKSGLILLQLVMLSALAYLGWISFSKYNTLVSQKAQVFSYKEYELALEPSWSSQQFSAFEKNDHKVNFRTSETEQIFYIQAGKEQLPISYSSLGIEHEDAQNIEQVSEIQGEPGCFSIQSKLFNFGYCSSSGAILYNRMGRIQRDEYLFAGREGFLWVFTHPNNNVLIVRVFGEGGLLHHSAKYPTEEKIQLIQRIERKKQSEMTVTILGFSRNEYAYSFNPSSFELISQAQKITHEISKLEKFSPDVRVEIANQVQVDQFYQTIQDLLYEVTWGKLGRKAWPPYRQFQKTYDVQILDTTHNLVLQINETKNQMNIISLQDKLLPFRTPIFISEEHYQRMKPIDEALNHSKNARPEDGIDFKVYDIRSKQIQQMKNKIGVYRLVPDASVHFLAFDSHFLSFYPVENLNKEEYYWIRNRNGGLVLKGNQIKGLFSDYPIANTDHSINYGYSSSEIYQQLTTNGKQMLPGIFQAHVLHKGMFTYIKKNKVELVSGISGKSSLTHYLQKAQNYQYSTSFIENNEFWVFEHSDLAPPFITKYELFVNSSTPKTMLYIKRHYEFPITGRITRVQKCIDGFYYFDYISANGSYGMARKHHVLMSNRQTLPSGKYSGAFQKAMLISNPERNPKLRVTELEEKALVLELALGANITDHWVQLGMKHQYQVLPYRVYLQNQTYYFFNIRQLLLGAYDWKRQQIEVKTHLTNAVVSGGLSLLFLLIILLRRPQTKRKSGDVEEKGQGENKGKKADKSKKE